jgi:DNA-binding PadR family transcriptional regulator
MSIAHAILGVLMDGDQHGYELARLLACRIGGEPYNTGQIHQALEQIERDGWAVSQVAVEGSRRRRQFRITPPGRSAFLRWLVQPVAPPRSVRDEMLVKLVFVAERDRAAAVRLLEARKRDLLRQLAEHRDAPRDPPRGRARFAVLTLDALRFRVEGELRWVDHAIAVLRPTALAPGAERAEDPPPPLERVASAPGLSSDRVG